MTTFQATVNEKLRYLQEALSEETQRRESVEQQAAENAKRRMDLEAAIEETQQSQERFQQLLEESQQQALVPIKAKAADRSTGMGGCAPWLKSATSSPTN